MIGVYASKRGEKYRLLVVGHAKESAEGVRVCAAVSALTEALSLYAKSRPDCRHVRLYVERGLAFLSCCYGLHDTFDMTVGALRRLAIEYPDHMCFSGNLSVNDKEGAHLLF
ncbi:MAG: hypothetical protein IKC75_05055 [Clostridia bacterium]|nr:hypothetical protein [Clostridia bacterium]